MRVALIHFPKTGGTTLHDFISTAFKAERVCPERFNNFDRFSDADLEGYDYFSAHMDFRNLRRINNPIHTVTVLREPKERILSLYYFWRAQNDEVVEKHNLVGPRVAKKNNLLDFLRWQDDGIPSNINNYYTRYLMGVNFTGPNGTLALSDEEAVRVAMRNLLTIDQVGFTDSLDVMFKKLGKLLGITPPDEIPKKRSSENFGKDPNTQFVDREELTEEIDAQLVRLTRLDDIIYRSARVLLSPAGE